MSSAHESANAPTPPPRNVHGRRPGRGLRPYLIVLKLLAVIAFAGGTMACLLLLTGRLAPINPSVAQTEAEAIRYIFVRVVVPGLLLAMLVGLLLAASIWRAVIRMRWFTCKLALILLGVPALHLYMRSRSLAWHASLKQPADLSRADAIRAVMTAGTAVVLVFAIVVLILGRIKPRLGQDYGRTFSRVR